VEVVEAAGGVNVIKLEPTDVHRREPHDELWHESPDAA